MKEQFGLYLILTQPRAGYEVCAQAAVACGVRYLQLRMKNTSPAALLETARTLRAITRGTATHLIINDHLTVAMESDADGVHLGQDDGSLTKARHQWNMPGKLFGLSTHSLTQAHQAEALSPDYIGVGPVFSTPTKRDTAPALGVEEVGRIIQASPLTTVAIGGINSTNLPHLLDAGIDNFCVVRAVNEAADPIAAIERLQKIWKRKCF
jgi:thiamine-phosphate pyrophosphorylase